MKPKRLVRRPSHHAPPHRGDSDFSERPSGSGPLRPSSITTATGDAQLRSHANGAHWEPKFPFDLLIAYEDETTRGRAFALRDHLATELDDEHDIRQSWWKLAFLYDSQLRERATEAATNADMIVISLNNGKELPLILRMWIEEWMKQKDGHDSALVALVNNAPSARCTDCPILRYLNSVARKAGMDFFPHVFPAAPLRADTNASARGPGLMPLLEEILRRPNNAHPWGINEY